MWCFVQNALAVMRDLFARRCAFIQGRRGEIFPAIAGTVQEGSEWIVTSDYTATVMEGSLKINFSELVEE